MNTPLEIKQTPILRVKFSGDVETGEFEGYASVFGNIDTHRDIVTAGAFEGTLAAHKLAGSAPAMLWMHAQDKPIGKWIELEEDAIGLRARGKLNMKTSAGRDAYAHVMDGDVSGLSIGYLLPPDGSVNRGGVRWLQRVELVEISVVTVPSNSSARIQLSSKGDLENLLTKSGLAKEAARRIAFGGFPALSGPDQTKAGDLAAEIARVTAQLKAL